jgi:L-malate glycosyltransferase
MSRGYEIIVVSNSALPQSPPDIPTRYLPGQSSLAYIRNIPAMRRVVSQFAPDIVHAHYATGYGLWGSSQHVAPLVVSVWGTDVADALNRRSSVGMIVRRSLREARFITATSKYLVDQTIALEPDVAGKIEIIPFGVPIPTEETARKEKTEDAPITVVFAKLYLSNYAPDMVIRAFARAHEDFSRLRLIMLGGGEMQQELEQLAVSLKVTDVATIHGWMEPDEARQIIRQSDIFVMPSLSESFGVAAAEAASYGLPVVASDVGGVPEIVRDGDTGLLIPPGDEAALAEAILRLAQDGQLRQSMGNAGRRLVAEKYDFEKCLDKMEAVYQKVLAG